MNKKHFTCVICPVGCSLTVDIDDHGKVLSVTGNKCKRGETYAISEIENPRRTITSTIKINNSDMSMLPVKTKDSIPKDKIFDTMKLINSIEIDAPIKIGDIIIDNILDTGVSLVATRNADKI
ncbi:MAG: DUF1667 domain-containing protein [Tissierellia bacterium]|nr:DUF1667 domain-containing protein [Tissierellia bacterium]